MKKYKNKEKKKKTTTLDTIYLMKPLSATGHSESSKPGSGIHKATLLTLNSHFQPFRA